MEVLVIDDSVTSRLLVKELLAVDGYRVQQASTGKEGITLARNLVFDLVVLDLGLPDIDGIKVCEELRTFFSGFIIIVTGRSSDIEKLEGLGAGADDYITKPFNPLEFLLRVEAISKRFRGLKDKNPEFLKLGDLELDLSARTALIGNQEISLTKIEYNIFEALALNEGQALDRETLAVAAWGSSEWLGNGHTLNVHVANMKKKISCSTSIKIQPVRGVGYRLTQK